MSDCGCHGVILHQVVHPDGKVVTYASEVEARAVANSDGGQYQAFAR